MLKTDWYNLYGESWKGAIVDDAFCHPAKYSRGLIRHIYNHAVKQGWLKAGDRVIDPFGGVALGGLDAMRLGLTWIGVELEQKFVDLGLRNIEMWNDLHADVMRGWGEAILLQGDSRNLRQVISGYVDGCISSPPYHKSVDRWGKERNEMMEEKSLYARYGDAEGQLEGLSPGDFQAAISSPPFGAGETRNRTQYQDGEVASMMGRAYTQDRQGTTPGQLGCMDAAISSPPFEDNVGSDDPDKRGGLFRDPKRRGDVNLTGEYGDSPGQLGTLKGGFECAVSSPPYEGSMERKGGIDPDKSEHVGGPHSQMNNSDTCYGETDGQLGAMRTAMLDEILHPPKDAPCGWTTEKTEQMKEAFAETFWSAAKVIVQQTYDLLVPGGHAIWVVKRFVRDKQIVEFPDMWQQLCESVGFRLVCRHRAMLIEDRGTQLDLFGNSHHKTVKRASFFRRLYESKYPENAIDWEDVLCFVKD